MASTDVQGSTTEFLPDFVRYMHSLVVDLCCYASFLVRNWYWMVKVICMNLMSSALPIETDIHVSCFSIELSFIVFSSSVSVRVLRYTVMTACFTPHSAIKNASCRLS